MDSPLHGSILQKGCVPAVQQAACSHYCTLTRACVHFLPYPHPQADTLYSNAVSHGLFPSQWQRPVMYERGLRAVPFWSTPELQAYNSDLSRVMSQLEEIKEYVRSSFSVVCVVVCMNMLLYTVIHACPPPHTHTQSLPLPREGLRILEENASLFRAENPTLLASGNWRTFSLYDKGRKNADNCNLAPKTCALLDSFRDASECTHGQVGQP